METLDSPPNHQVRLNWLSDPALFFSQLARVGSEQDANNLQIAGNELFNRLKDYKIAVVTLLEMPIEDVGPIFERINSRGTPLTIVDLMRAATWSDKFDLFDKIDELLDEIAAKNFGNIDRKAILRSLSAAVGGGFSESSIDNLRRFDPDRLSEASVEIKNAYKLSVDFLATELSIPSDRHIPYVNQVVVLAEVFRALPNPSATQRSILKRWFWRTAVTGYFGGWNTGNMAADKQSIEKFVTGATAELEMPISDPGINVWVSQQFRLNTAHAKILALLLAFNKPIDLLSGQKIDTDRALHFSNSKEFHHFFPRDFLVNQGVSPREANFLANFIMITSESNKKISNRAPSIYLKEVEKVLGSQFNSALEANLISQAAYEAAKVDNYRLFIQERAKTIDAKTKELTGW